MTDQELIDLVLLNEERIDANISRLNRLLVLDETSGYAYDINASLVQSVSDINTWVNSLSDLIDSKHDAQQDEIDDNTFLSASNLARLDALLTEENTGIIPTMQDEIDALTLSMTSTLDGFSTTYDNLLDNHYLLIQANADGLVTQAGNYTNLGNTVTTNQANFILRAEAIELSVTELTESTNGDYLSLSASIDINANSIISAVSSIEGIGNDIIDMGTLITQNANSIVSEASLRETLAGRVTVNETNITQTADAVVIWASATDSLSDRVDTAEVNITATEASISVLSTITGTHDYTIEALMALTSNTFGVQITETAGGIPYAVGFELILYPTWLLGETYTINVSIVTYTDQKVYKCIQTHVASTANAPDAGMNSLWNEETTKERSAFIVAADEFKVINPDAASPTALALFDVNTSTGAVTVNGDLLVNRIESVNYEDDDEKWFVLDPDTGEATFHNMTMTVGSAGKDAIQAALDAGADISACEINGVTIIDGDGKIITDLLLADEILAAATETGTLIVNEKLHSSGKTSFADTTPGFYLGYDATNGNAFNVGTSTTYLKFSTAGMQVGGPVIFTDNIQDNAITSVASGHTAASVTFGLSGAKTTVTGCVVPNVTAEEIVYVNFSAVLDVPLDTNSGYFLEMWVGNGTTSTQYDYNGDDLFLSGETFSLQSFAFAFPSPYTTSTLQIAIVGYRNATSSGFPDAPAMSERTAFGMVIRK